MLTAAVDAGVHRGGVGGKGVVNVAVAYSALVEGDDECSTAADAAVALSELRRHRRRGLAKITAVMRAASAAKTIRTGRTVAREVSRSIAPSTRARQRRVHPEIEPLTTRRAMRPAASDPNWSPSPGRARRSSTASSRRRAGSPDRGAARMPRHLGDTEPRRTVPPKSAKKPHETMHFARVIGCRKQCASEVDATTSADSPSRISSREGYSHLADRLATSTPPPSGPISPELGRPRAGCHRGHAVAAPGLNGPPGAGGRGRSADSPSHGPARLAENRRGRGAPATRVGGQEPGVGRLAGLKLAAYRPKTRTRSPNDVDELSHQPRPGRAAPGGFAR